MGIASGGMMSGPPAAPAKDVTAVVNPARRRSTTPAVQSIPTV